MKKLPYGISNYEKLITENYYYSDKTMYIEKLENIAETSIMFLRPRKFGKTLFTSTLEFYYDINATDKFETLYGNTYIGKNPTPLKNSYHILRFNFSGIDTSTGESTIHGFRREVASSINVFVKKYGLDFWVNENDSAEDILDNLFKAFKYQKNEEKIYVIIDEYDHFANELLGFQTEQFKELVSRNGKVRKWYEILKKGTETIVDRIFITGVAPITLDSMTSGFNIGSDKTKEGMFNEMLGFTEEELLTMMEDQEISKENQEKILPVMKENYDGYMFSQKSKVKIYNSNMCLYFLNQYVSYKEIPDSLMDVNIASDYSKIGKMLNLCKGERRLEILEKTLSGEGIEIELTEKFNPAVEFGETEFASMLFYLGYLTIKDGEFGYTRLTIPNKMMKEIYAEYFLVILKKEYDMEIDKMSVEVVREIALEGKIDKMLELLHKYLNNLSNRDFQRFDEKYVKLIFYCLVMNLKEYSIKSEPEINRKYPDILIVPREVSKGYHAIMVEFKYLKAGEQDKIKEKQKEAREQIEEYSQFEDIKNIENLNKYTVVAVNDELYVENIN